MSKKNERLVAKVEIWEQDNKVSLALIIDGMLSREDAEKYLGYMIPGTPLHQWFMAAITALNMRTGSYPPTVAPRLSVVKKDDE